MTIRSFQILVNLCVELRTDLMFSLVCTERIQLRGMQKESIEELSMEINLEICNRTIKCSSAESSL